MPYFPQVHVTAVYPPVADDAQPFWRNLEDFRPVVVLETVIEYVLPPRPALWLRLLVHAQAAAAAVRLEGVVLSDDQFEFTVAVQVGHVERMGRTHLVNDVHPPRDAARIARMLEPGDAHEKGLAGHRIVQALLHHQDVWPAVAVHVGHPHARNVGEIVALDNLVRVEGAIAHVLEPVSPGDDVQLAVAGEVASHKLLAVGELRQDSLWPGVNSRIGRNLEQLREIAVLLGAVVARYQCQPATGQKRRDECAMWPVAVADADGVLLPLAVEWVHRLQPAQFAT